MLHRRQNFVKEIRRQQRQEVKSRIRGKLLLEINQQRDQSELQKPLCLDLRPIYTMFDGFCDRETQQNKPLHEFLHMMMELTRKYNGDDGSAPSIMTPLSFLVTFSQNLALDHSRRNIQSILQSYEAALNHAYKYFLYIQTERPGLIEASSYCMWNSAFNMLILILVHVKDVRKTRISAQNQQRLSQYFSEWIERTYCTLEVLSQPSIEFNNLYHESIIQSLKELSQFCRLAAKQQAFYSLKKIFTWRMIKVLKVTLISYRMDQTGKILTTGILLQAASSHLSNTYHDILEQGICDDMRQIIAFQTHLQMNQKIIQRENEERIISNLLQFMYQGCYLSSSDIFWEKGVISELLANLTQGVANKVLRQDIITLIIVAITTISKSETLDLINQASIFEWVLNLIHSCIELRAHDNSLTQLINNGILALRFFIEWGEIIKNQENTYIVKLKYTSGIPILEQCPEGQEFLSEINLHSEEL